MQKCPYCDFNSHALRGDLPEKAYLQALIVDLEQELLHVQGRTLQSIFMGGGTPSLFSPNGLHHLLQDINQRIPFEHNIEITLEANPGTVEQTRFAGFKSAGVNRISLGIQSFNDDHLKRLGRIHGRDEALAAVRALTQAGFDNFNLDIMFGLPNQTVEEGLADLDCAIQLNPPHFSWYQLTLEPNTLFFHQPPVLPQDDVIWEMQEKGKAKLIDAGYTQYEISAFSRERPCQHNLNYWMFGDYLGIGAGAHGKVTTKDEIQRYWKPKHPQAYLKEKSPFAKGGRAEGAGGFCLSDKDKIAEFMLNALRLYQPISYDLFELRTGLQRDLLQPYFEPLIQKKLLNVSDHSFMPTPLGHAFLNDLLAVFI